MDKVANEAQIYTDVQGLEDLRYQAKMKNPAAKKEVAKQFEALLLQQVLQSMNNANKELSGGLFGSDQMDMYQDLYSKQLSILITQQDLGFAKVVEENMNQQYHLEDKKASAQNTVNTSLLKSATVLKMPKIANINPTPAVATTTAPPAVASIATLAPQKNSFGTPEDFVKSLWASAKIAAKMINADPKVLIAQAALETDWGKKILHLNPVSSTHNLFNIKSDSSWNKSSVSTTTLEEQDGVVKKEKSSFRAYGSYIESFLDYAHYLQSNNRYAQALTNAANPANFVQSLQAAGFATDSHYADKIMNILHSDSFNSLIKRVENDF